MPPSPDVTPLRGLARVQVSLGGLRCADLLAVELEGALSRETLTDAVPAWVRRHAVLRARVMGCVSEGVRWSEAPSPWPVAWDERPWPLVAQELLAVELGGDAPSWALRAVPAGARTFLLLAVHHALVDGRSLSILLSDLLRACTERLPPGHGPAPVAPLDLAPSPTWLRASAPLARAWWANQIRASRASTPFPSRSLDPEEPVATWFTARDLPEGLVPLLRRTARRHDATVGGALVLAAQAATFEVARRTPSRVPVETMVDLRPLLGAPAEVGPLAGGAAALGGERRPFTWSAARSSVRWVKRQLAVGSPLWVQGAVDAEDPAAALRHWGVDLHAHAGAGAVTQVSNLGPWTGDTTFGPLRVVGAWSGTAALRTGPVLLAWLRTVGDRGCVSAIGNAVAVERDRVEQFMVRLCDRLGALADG